MNTEDILEIRINQANQWYTENIKNKKGIDCVPRFGTFLNLIGNYKDTKVLDIGCGLGDFLYMLKKNGFANITGMDGSKIAVEYARKITNLPIILMDIEKNEFDTFVNKNQGKYDIVIMGDIIEHIFAPKRILSKVRNLLSKDGKLLISVPNSGWILNGILLTFFPKYLGFSPAFGSWTHCNYYTFFSLKEQLRECGFKVLKSRGCPIKFMGYSKNPLKYIACLFVNCVYRLLNIFSSIKPSVVSPHIIFFAQRDNTNTKIGKRDWGGFYE